MAEKETRRQHGQGDGQRRTASGARLLPRVTFGLGVAVLTGAVVVSVNPVGGAPAASADRVMTTQALGAVINEVHGNIPTLTTCCGQK